MTGVTTGLAFDVILINERFRCLRIERPTFLDVEYTLSTRHRQFGVSMTFQAPLHVQGIFSPHQGHLVHLPVTFDAANSFVDVDAVIEINVIRQIVNSGPLKWLIGSHAVPHWGEHGTLSEQLRMTIHAYFGWRDSREGRVFYARVAVATIEADIPDMMLVTEWHGLVTNHSDFRDVG